MRRWARPRQGAVAPRRRSWCCSRSGLWPSRARSLHRDAHLPGSTATPTQGVGRCAVLGDRARFCRQHQHVHGRPACTGGGALLYPAGVSAVPGDRGQDRIGRRGGVVGSLTIAALDADGGVEDDPLLIVFWGSFMVLVIASTVICGHASVGPMILLVLSVSGAATVLEGVLRGPALWRRCRGDVALYGAQAVYGHPWCRGRGRRAQRVVAGMAGVAARWTDPDRPGHERGRGERGLGQEQRAGRIAGMVR